MTPERPTDPRAAPPATAPATGSADVRDTEVAPEEEPVAAGTLFLTTIILMIIVGFWVIIYIRLLNR